ncbi:MAG: SET domain-containing protein-lysine N-methyltransferase [Nanoarchaeota archaeon]|nr:SET domain-containing protein-lysine N-methyltransferase [Nanoarchaeota archaeon]
MNISVKSSRGKGRGVFAEKTFNIDDVIENCPVIVLPKEELRHIDKTVLYDYYYGWGRRPMQKGAIALGFGSLYNNSYHPNAIYKRDARKRCIIIICIRKIIKGEEITINYNGDPKDQTPVWFEMRK